MTPTIVTASSGKEYELVVGLEVHCELATTTKLFCGCPNSFGSVPNTNVCPVCLGCQARCRSSTVGQSSSRCGSASR